MQATQPQPHSMNPFSNPENANILLAHLPGLVLYKNVDLVYTASSNYAARLCGFTDNQQFTGHNDFELRCGAVASAEDFRNEDRRVIAAGTEMTCLQIHRFADGNIHIFIVRKAPVINSQSLIIGVCSVGNEVANPVIGKAIFNLLALGNPHYARNVNFHVNINNTFKQLSNREEELLFYFMRGFGIKEIGIFMKLSPRTVESYLETIKYKFNCETRNELLLFCMQEGFSFIIPQNIFNRCINKSIAW